MKSWDNVYCNLDVGRHDTKLFLMTTKPFLNVKCVYLRENLFALQNALNKYVIFLSKEMKTRRHLVLANKVL